jgi:hypothetical protein
MWRRITGSLGQEKQLVEYPRCAVGMVSAMKENETSSRTMIWVAIATLMLVGLWLAAVRIAESNRDERWRPQMPGASQPPKNCLDK